MTQITLRGIDGDLEKKIRKEAKERGKSLNKIILEKIYNHTRPQKGKKEPQANSLKKLAGGWSRKEADNFFESIKSCEQIDEAMWR